MCCALHNAFPRTTTITISAALPPIVNLREIHYAVLGISGPFINKLAVIFMELNAIGRLENRSIIQNRKL